MITMCLLLSEEKLENKDSLYQFYIKRGPNEDIYRTLLYRSQEI